MAPLTSTFANAWPDKVDAHLTDVASMFELGEDALKAIAQRFLQDFNHGLSEYGQAMAMMYALSFSARNTAHEAHTVLLSSLAYQTAQKLGAGTSSPPYTRDLNHTAVLSLLSTSAAPICELFMLYFLPDGYPICRYADRRVCKVDLKGDTTFTLKQQKYKVSEQLKTGEATALFGTLYVLSAMILGCLRSSVLLCILRGNMPVRP
jgi:hypothetical protein